MYKCICIDSATDGKSGSSLLPVSLPLIIWHWSSSHPEAEVVFYLLNLSLLYVSPKLLESRSSEAVSSEPMAQEALHTAIHSLFLNSVTTYKQAQPSTAWLVSVANPNWPESSWPASSLHYMNESNEDQSSLAQSRRTVQSSHTEY